MLFLLCFVVWYLAVGVATSRAAVWVDETKIANTPRGRVGFADDRWAIFIIITCWPGFIVFVILATIFYLLLKMGGAK